MTGSSASFMDSMFVASEGASDPDELTHRVLMELASLERSEGTSNIATTIQIH